MTAPAVTPVRRRRLGVLGAALDPQLRVLQDGYLTGRPTARAQLAQLRRGLGKSPGALPEIWQLTVGAVPESLRWERDEPTRAEQAAHAAMALYAVHQQSQTLPAHVPGISFGAATARLRSADSTSDAAVTRRFMAVATAESLDEVLTHVRGLVTQLRGREIGFDYAAFADDLAALLSPTRKTNVRLRWGRDFYRTTALESQTTNVDDGKGN